MISVKILYPKDFENFVSLICEKTGAPIEEARKTAVQIWRIYYTHQTEKASYAKELSEGKQAQLSELIDKIIEFAKSSHKELVTPEIRGTAEAMLGAEYDNLEEALSKVQLIAGVAKREQARTSRLYKRRRGEKGEWGRTYGARILIDFYEKWTGRKATIVHAYRSYSGGIYNILCAWARLTGIEISGDGINSLHERAKKLSV